MNALCHSVTLEESQAVVLTFGDQIWSAYMLCHQVSMDSERRESGLRRPLKVKWSLG